MNRELNLNPPNRKRGKSSNKVSIIMKVKCRFQAANHAGLAVEAQKMLSDRISRSQPVENDCKHLEIMSYSDAMVPLLAGASKNDWGMAKR